MKFKLLLVNSLIGKVQNRIVLDSEILIGKHHS